jgi:serine/threonine protein kinase/Flp pilus assembly protein TadD
MRSPGTRLGPYELIAPIAAGGMGEVYRARDLRLAREVAIKILPDTVSSNPEMVARFQEEARVLASVNHPNIMAIYDVGAVGDLSYEVFELIEGDTLRQRLGKGAFTTAATVEYSRQILEGIGAAHDRGIVHRDLKPENIIVTTGEHIKILDFGIAKARSRATGDDTVPALTQPGLVLGTIGYMAPEQLKGQPIDHRVDLFAFGVILHEMLTGRRAFHGASDVEVVSSILTEQIPNPAQTDPGVPHALGTIMCRCLERDPQQRYQSAAELLNALSLIDATDGHPPSRSPKAPDWPSVAVLPFADMSPQKDQEYLCDGLAEEIMGALSQAKGLRVLARSSTFQFKGASRDVREIGRSLGATAILEGSIRKAPDRIRIAVQLVNSEEGHQIWSERFDRDLQDVLAMQDEIAQRVADALEARLIQPAGGSALRQTGDLEAYTHYLKARFHWNRRTEADLDLSVTHLRQALERDPAYALAHAGLAEALTTLAVYGVRAPDDVLPQARAAAHRALELSSDLGSAYSCLGCIQSLHDWSWAAAARAFRRAIAINPDDASAHQALATNYLVPLSRFDEALSELTLATALDPLSLAVSSTVGVTLFYAGRYDEAEKALAETLRIDDRFPLAHMFLGQVRSAQHRYRDALDSLDAAVRLGHRAPEMLAALGYALARSGDAEGARRVLAELSALSERRYVSPTAFAQLEMGLGDRAAALDALERATQVHSLDLAWLPVRPFFADLKGDARYEHIVNVMGVAAAGRAEAKTSG